MAAKISYYRDDTTGELVTPHLLGETEDGRKLYQAIEGYSPANEDGTSADVECDENGNWVPAEAGLSLEDQVRILSTITNRDHAGRHFTERYSDDTLAALESAGLITIDRPVHEATGIDYSREYWTLTPTEAAIDLVNLYPEYHDTEV